MLLAQHLKHLCFANQRQLLSVSVSRRSVRLVCSSARIEAGMRLPIFQVDAFSSSPFGGNPAAVCLLSKEHLPLSDTIRQKIAAEMNLAETAFIEPLDPASVAGVDVFKSHDTFKLRWFTPTVEVPLCGHATLASAAVLFEEVENSNSSLHFQTLSGTLSVSRAAISDANSKQPLEMVLPRLDVSHTVPKFATNNDAFLKAVVGDLEVAEIRYNNDIAYLLVVLSDKTSRQQLESIQADMAGMQAAATGGAIRGVIVTVAGGGEPYDVLSRFFAPWCGIPEDPVTGSAHSLLAPYWAERLGKSELKARQCSSRGGDLTMKDDPASNTVTVSGYSTVVLKGQLTI